MFPISTHWMVRLSALPLAVLESEDKKEWPAPRYEFKRTFQEGRKARPDHAALPSRAITLLREVLR